MTTATRRRPRRANCLKDLGRLLGVTGTTHEDSRNPRGLEFVAEQTNDAAKWIIPFATRRALECSHSSDFVRAERCNPSSALFDCIQFDRDTEEQGLFR